MADLTLYARVRNSDDKVKETRLFEDGYPESELSHKFGAEFTHRWISVVELPAETFDPKTQKLAHVQTVEPTRVTEQDVAIDLTAKEKKRIKLNDNALATKAQVQALVDVMQDGTKPSSEEVRVALLYVFAEIGIE